MAHQLILHHYWRSSCSWRVRWALAIKGLPYESVAVNLLAGEHGAADYVARNPSGWLPALTVDGVAFGESLAICEWLEEAYPTPALLPADAFARLAVRQMALTIASGTQPLQNPGALKRLVADEGAREGHAQYWIERGLGIYDALVARGQPGAYSWGDTITLADLCLVPQVFNARRFKVDVAAKFPRLEAIVGRCLATPACAASAPGNQPGATG